MAHVNDDMIARIVVDGQEEHSDVILVPDRTASLTAGIIADACRQLRY